MVRLVSDKKKKKTMFLYSGRVGAGVAARDATI